MPKLVLPSTKYKNSYISALKRMAGTEPRGPSEESRKLALADFKAFLDRLEIDRIGINLPKHRVPQTKYWLVGGDRKFIGEISIRHRLNKKLMNFGGHIGYWVRPSERGRGYGKLMLRLALPKARRLGIHNALVT